MNNTTTFGAEVYNKTDKSYGPDKQILMFDLEFFFYEKGRLGLQKQSQMFNLESAAVVLALKRRTWVLHSTHRLINVDVCAKYSKIISCKKLSHG